MNAQALAERFSEQLRATLTVEQLAYCIDANSRETDHNVCHSHDHIDANEVMLAAWLSLEPADDVDSILNDDSKRALWVEAWTMAKESRFGVGMRPYVEGMLGE